MKRSIKPGDDVDYSLYNFDTHEFVCSSHINDNYIRKFINEKGSIGKCTYCNKNRTVIELAEVLKVIVVGIDYLFEDPVEFKYLDNEAETGFDGDNFYFDELFYERLGLEIKNSKLSEHIFKYLDNISLYYYKDEYGSYSEYLSDLWQLFKYTVKHRARFVFYYKEIFRENHLSDPVSILNDVQASIQNFKLFRKISNTEKLYRCRQHKTTNEIKEAKDLSSPPDHLCKAYNRMSAVGISMFYCSTDEKLCIQEVVDNKDLSKPFFTTAYFTSKSDLNLVDLTNLPSIPSIYDAENNKYIDTIYFLQEFIEDISKPIDPLDTLIEYIPTQVVTEYIRFNPVLNADGIIYPSSKGEALENIVLFKNQEECLDELVFNEHSITTKQIIKV